jgi:hypothetical protein
MTDLKKRFVLYGFGFFIGILLVFFFLGGKKASCSWLPNDRMLRIIRSKHIEYSDSCLNTLALNTLDTIHVRQILLNGDIDFSKSNVKNDPCRSYYIQGADSLKKAVIIVKVCDSVATVESFMLQD